MSSGLERLGTTPVDFAVHRSSLDDVFLALTGKQGGPAPEPAAAAAVVTSKEKQSA
ncbi:hypothetical protein [Streptomyces sp. DSM 40750]|uniref:hypothetical protein n=1 Tax=Streptomyces sp. DSM 40750 TaxID=2801030 RepID=UPI00214A9D51|nr:hypothetical protein [Streptomyces sp. DSM 40750]UUU25887.1 hypothetical protein JIX55_39770 [Streptomyces sp. DSM 40750]